MSRDTVFISHATPQPDEEPESESGELVEIQQKVPAKSETKEPTERTDDPVRMYLREMRPVKLLSREGEIAIAKRIEAGREAMIAGLCESPLTFQAIIIWREELNEGARSSCATSSTSKRPMRVPTRRPCRRR
jgi:RNA polymerase primary sigma factor